MTTDYRHLAEFWVDALRKGTFAYEDAVIKVRNYLAQGNLTLADIGSSEEELTRGRELGCKLHAIDLIEKLRRGSLNDAQNLKGLYDHMEKGCLSPDDFGSSDNELKHIEGRIRQRAQKAA